MLALAPSPVPTAAAVDALQAVMAFLPRLAVALGLALSGGLAAWLLRLVSVHFLRGWGSRLAGGIGRLFRSRDAEREVRGAALGRPVAAAVGSIVFWLVFLFFLAAATESLGLPVISAWISGVAAYLPRLLVGALIVILGLLAGGIAHTALAATAASAGFAYADALGRLAQAMIVMASVIVAFDQLGVAMTFLTVLAGIVTGALLGGAALAFGLGARTAVANIIAAHYLIKTYRVGHRVRIGEHEGRIVDITPTTVVIATAEGQAVVPAKEFSERASVLVTS